MDGRRTGMALLATLVTMLGLTAAPPRGASIDELIGQLGSPKFAEREAAGKALDVIGAPALDRLRKAISLPNDLETRRRAEALFKAIDKRIETAELLQPTRVKLDYQDIPVPQAVRDFAKRTGYVNNVILWDPKGQLAQRKITLATPELSFWEALDKLCERANLSHLVGAQEWQASLSWPGRALRPDHTLTYGQVVLVDDKFPANTPRPASTCYSGVFRIRAYPAKAPAQSAGYVTVMLEILPEPKLRWHGHSHVTLHEGSKEKEASVTQVELLDDTGNLQQGFECRDGATDFSSPNYGLRPGELHLKLRDKAAKTAKLLKGVIVACVQTPKRTLLTVDNILQAGNKSFHDKDDNEITFLQAEKMADGAVRMRFRHAVSSKSTGGGHPGFSFGHEILGLHLGRNDISFHLFDNQGKPFPKISAPEVTRLPGRGNKGICEWQATLHPATKEATPNKLECRVSRMTTIEVPFEFKDVRLP